MQRKVAFIGTVENISTHNGAMHHGAYSDTTKTFKSGGITFSGDFGTMPFSAKNCLKFETIYTEYKI